MLVAVATFFRPLSLAPGIGLIVVAMRPPFLAPRRAGPVVAMFVVAAAGGPRRGHEDALFRPLLMRPVGGLGVLKTLDAARRGLRRKDGYSRGLSCLQTRYPVPVGGRRDTYVAPT